MGSEMYSVNGCRGSRNPRGLRTTKLSERTDACHAERPESHEHTENTPVHVTAKASHTPESAKVVYTPETAKETERTAKDADKPESHEDTENTPVHETAKVFYTPESAKVVNTPETVKEKKHPESTNSRNINNGTGATSSQITPQMSDNSAELMPTKDLDAAPTASSNSSVEIITNNFVSLSINNRGEAQETPESYQTANSAISTAYVAHPAN